MATTMNCDCGIAAFFYTTIKKDQTKYEIYKCGTLLSENKKGKCEFNVEIPIKKIKHPDFCIFKDSEEKKIAKDCEFICTNSDCEFKCTNSDCEFKCTNKEFIINELEKYIHLFEISKNNYGMSRDNYISNINFNLKKLGFPLFFIHKETINSLKLRIYNVVLKKPIKKKYYPVVILEIPENLKTINKKNTLKNKRVEKRNTTNKTVPNLILHEDEFLNKIKNMEIKSDSESESESGADDNSFDVDNYDSDEIEQYDESGGLSD
jgi:hypothetical protein